LFVGGSTRTKPLRHKQGEEEEVGSSSDAAYAHHFCVSPSRGKEEPKPLLFFLLQDVKRESENKGAERIRGAPPPPSSLPVKPGD